MARRADDLTEEQLSEINAEYERAAMAEAVREGVQRCHDRASGRA